LQNPPHSPAWHFWTLPFCRPLSCIAFEGSPTDPHLRRPVGDPRDVLFFLYNNNQHIASLFLEACRISIRLPHVWLAPTEPPLWPHATTDLRNRPLRPLVPLRALPWYQSLNQWPLSEHRTGWARSCSICGSQLLDQEKNGWCCNQWAWQLDPLEPYPAAFAGFLDQNIQALQDHTRTLNNLFAFSAIGYTGR
jgi:hypothetical protein